MSLVVQVLGARVQSGTGKQSGRPYEMTICAVAFQNDKGVQVGELVINGGQIPAPGKYAVELEPQVRDGRVSFGARGLTPVPAAAK